jgi:hypothetical protein
MDPVHESRVSAKAPQAPEIPQRSLLHCDVGKHEGLGGVDVKSSEYYLRDGFSEDIAKFMDWKLCTL